MCCFSFGGNLLRFDMFGRKVSLRYDNDDLFKTKCGGFASILVILTIVVFTSFELSQILKGKIINVTTSIRPINYRKIRTSGWEKQVILGYAFKDGVKFEQFFEVVAYLQGKQNSTVFLKFEDCSGLVDSHLSDKVPHGMKARCLKVSSDLLLKQYTPILMFKKCTKEPRSKQLLDQTGQENSTCSPYPTVGSGEIFQRIKQLTEKMDFYFFSTLSSEVYTENDFKLVDIMKSKRVSVSVNFQKEYKMILGLKEVTRNMPLSMQPHVKRGFLFLRDHSDVTSLQTTDYFLKAKVVFDFSSMFETKKNYQSVINLLSFLGGLFKGLSALFLVIIFPVREILFYKKLINDMFNVCEDLNDLEKAFSELPGGLKGIYRQHETLNTQILDKAAKDEQSPKEIEEEIRKMRKIKLQEIIKNSSDQKKFHVKRRNNKRRLLMTARDFENSKRRHSPQINHNDHLGVLANLGVDQVVNPNLLSIPNSENTSCSISDSEVESSVKRVNSKKKKNETNIFRKFKNEAEVVKNEIVGFWKQEIQYLEHSRRSAPGFRESPKSDQADSVQNRRSSSLSQDDKQDENKLLQDEDISDDQLKDRHELQRNTQIMQSKLTLKNLLQGSSVPNRPSEAGGKGDPGILASRSNNKKQFRRERSRLKTNELKNKFVRRFVSNIKDACLERKEIIEEGVHRIEKYNCQIKPHLGR